MRRKYDIINVVNKTLVRNVPLRGAASMKMVFGYCGVITKRQNLERQVRTNLAVYPDAKIYREKFTGTKFDGRKQLDRILK